MIPTDLRATLTYETKASLDRIGTNLLADGKRIPGWYLRVYYNEGYTDIYKYTRLSPQRAEALAEAFDVAATTNDDRTESTSDDRPTGDYVRRVNAQHERALRDRLQCLPILIQELRDEQARITGELSPQSGADDPEQLREASRNVLSVPACPNCGGVDGCYYGCTDHD